MDKINSNRLLDVSMSVELMQTIKTSLDKPKKPKQAYLEHNWVDTSGWCDYERNNHLNWLSSTNYTFRGNVWVCDE